jgi:hypothetical protein
MLLTIDEHQTVVVENPDFGSGNSKLFFTSN